MKKLMIASAALCAAVCANAVESQNVVGYAEPELGDNANLAGAPFDMVGAAGMDINQIIPKNAGIFGGAFTMKLLQSDLSDDAEYYFIPEAEAPDGGSAGWFLDDMSTRVSKTFAPGEGFIIMNNLSDSAVSFSGEVAVGKPTWEVAPNANLAGNITPIDLDINDIVLGASVDANGNVVDPNGEVFGGSCTLKLLQSDLSDDAEYYYIPEAEAPDGGSSGWFLDDMTTRVSRTFAPGEGFIIMCNLSSAFVQIPAALTAN